MLFSLSPRRVLLLCLLSLLSVAAQALVQIDNVRVYRAPEYTRFVFDVSEPPQYQVLPDAAPGRVVIDFRGAELKAKLETVDLQDSPVRRVRSGQQPDGTIRVVFDLAVAVRVNSFTLQPNDQYGHRLVVDLYDQAATQKAKTVDDFVEKSAAGPRKLIVAVDAGHGGEDPGAHGLNGTREKDVVLSIARAVRDQMKEEPGMKPVMIRDGDYYVGLKERRITARKKYNADLFVSIHADAFTRRNARGASVFAVSRRGATSNTAAYLAEAENRADQVGGIDPKSDDDVVNVISDLIMEGTMSHSLHVGRSVLDELGGFAKLHKGSVEQAGFMVLKEPNMPSILVETGFISNPDEEKLLRSAAYQQHVAKAVVAGVRKYFEHYPPPGSLYAALRDGKPARDGKVVIAANPAAPVAVKTATDDASDDSADEEDSAADGADQPDTKASSSGTTSLQVAENDAVPPRPVVPTGSTAVVDPAPSARSSARSSAREAAADDAAPAPKPAVKSAAKPATRKSAKPARKSAPKAAAKKKEEFIVHKVGRGQSLGYLAQKYGVSQRAIKEANGMKRNDVYIGETLKIPKP